MEMNLIGKDQICERCNGITKTLKMSFFNEDMLCHECLEKESKHPLYQKAKEVELEQCKKGNYNFKGIGLPIDL